MLKIDAMRKLLTMVVILVTTLNGYCPNNEFVVVTNRPDYNQSVLLAIMTVESGGDLNSINVEEGAHGALQIRMPVIKDVNRYYGKNFTIEDAYILDSAITMFWLYQNMWVKDQTLENIARTWNGGPKGVYKQSTVKYYLKVLTEFERVQEQYLFKSIERKVEPTA